MIEEKVTLTGYNSKKQPYIFLVSSVSALIMGVLFLIFNVLLVSLMINVKHSILFPSFVG